MLKMESNFYCTCPAIVYKMTRDQYMCIKELYTLRPCYLRQYIYFYTALSYYFIMSIYLLCNCTYSKSLHVDHTISTRSVEINGIIKVKKLSVQLIFTILGHLYYFSMQYFNVSLH